MPNFTNLFLDIFFVWKFVQVSSHPGLFWAVWFIPPNTCDTYGCHVIRLDRTHLLLPFRDSCLDLYMFSFLSGHSLGHGRDIRDRDKEHIRKDFRITQFLLPADDLGISSLGTLQNVNINNPVSFRGHRNIRSWGIFLRMTGITAHVKEYGFFRSLCEITSFLHDTLHCHELQIFKRAMEAFCFLGMTEMRWVTFQKHIRTILGTISWQSLGNNGNYSAWSRVHSHSQTKEIISW